MLDGRTVEAAAATGRGALARLLRDARYELGAQRAGSLLKGLRFGRSLTLLVAAPFQPRALVDALRLAFAIVDIGVELRLIDGLGALAETLRADEAPDLDGIDMALLPLLIADTGPAVELAAGLSQRCAVPVLVVGAETASSRNGVEGVTLDLAGSTVDERFAGTFGQLPTPEAADRIGDLAAARAARLLGGAPKLLVTDLDGTLWSGTLGEEGIDGIELDRAYANALRTLATGGMLLAVASRNDSRDVDGLFASRSDWPISLEHFAAVEVGWQAKDAMVAALLERLGLAAEHLVFVDDDPVNCAHVAARFPQADVRLSAGDRAAFARTLLADPLLRTAAAANGDRAAQYRRRAEVERLREDTSDIGEFLRRLRSVVTVVPLRPSLLPRAAELASRVNQFTLNGWRPRVVELSRRASPLDFMVQLDDAFGAHGLVGLFLASVSGEGAEVQAFCLSCRALGRGVELAMLQAAARLASEAGCTSLHGSIDDLPRNEPARAFFSRYRDVTDGRYWTFRPELDSAAVQGTTVRWTKATT